MPLRDNILMKRIALVDIMGGLGNQLHQISMAKYLQNSGYKILINTSWFKNHDFSDGTEKRILEINIKDFGFKEASKRNLNYFEIIDKSRNMGLLKRIYISKLNLIYKLNSGDEFNESKFYFINRFSGYWQNPKYLLKDKDFFINALNKNNDFYTNPTQSSNNNRTLIHIRRGQDYIKWGEDLPKIYFKNAFNNLLDKEKNTSYDIFTDEIKYDTSDPLYKNADNIFNDTNEKSMTILSKMLDYKNFIISNSSLSFFAAYLGESENSNIFYPDPWFKSINHVTYKNTNWNQVQYE
tara:strand:- start:266 stop:1150 length:885 start_codon:yes stop_codon:yes gene_type:complete